MTRTTPKDAHAKAVPKAFPEMPPFASTWPLAGSDASAPAAVENFRKVSEFQMEIARFATVSARKNASTLAALATCRTPLDVLETWRKASIDAVTDYADEAARMLDRARN